MAETIQPTVFWLPLHFSKTLRLHKLVTKLFDGPSGRQLASARQISDLDSALVTSLSGFNQLRSLGSFKRLTCSDLLWWSNYYVVRHADILKQAIVNVFWD